MCSTRSKGGTRNGKLCIRQSVDACRKRVGCSAQKWGEADVLAGGTDLISLMKDHLHTPKRVVNIKNIKELDGIQKTADGLRIGALVTHGRACQERRGARRISSRWPMPQPASPARKSATWGPWAAICASVPAAGITAKAWACLAMKDGKSLMPDGENKLSLHLRRRTGLLCQRFQPGTGADRAGCQHEAGFRQGHARSPGREVLRDSHRTKRRAKSRCCRTRSSRRSSCPAGGTHSATYEVRQKEALDWPLVAASVALKMNGNTVTSAKIVLGHVAPAPHQAAAAEKALAGKPVTAATAEAAAKAAVTDAKPLSQNAYKVTLARTAVKRALLDAAKVKA